jgi:hypothetical protein
MWLVRSFGQVKSNDHHCRLIVGYFIKFNKGKKRLDSKHKQHQSAKSTRMNVLTVVSGLDIECPASGVHRKIGCIEQRIRLSESDKTSCITVHFLRQFSTNLLL